MIPAIVAPHLTTTPNRTPFVLYALSMRSARGRTQALLPPSLLLPEARLQVLLVQALEAQRSACRVHNTDRRQMSLLHDHQCEGQIPTHTLQILDEHTDEVRIGSTRPRTPQRIIRSTTTAPRPLVAQQKRKLDVRRHRRWGCVPNAHQQ